MKNRKKHYKEKCENVLKNYPYLYVLQHNNISAEIWIKIKTELFKKFHEEKKLPILKVIPNSISKDLFLESSCLKGPSCFFGCYSIQDIQVLFEIIECLKGKDKKSLQFFSFGLFVANSTEHFEFKNQDDKKSDMKFKDMTFMNFLEINKFLSLRKKKRRVF